MELDAPISPFLSMKELNCQVLTFMRPCKIRRNGYLQAIVHWGKRNKTISVDMERIVMDICIRDYTIESFFHHSMIVFACKEYPCRIKISISDTVVNSPVDGPIFRFLRKLVYDHIRNAVQPALLIPFNSFILIANGHNQQIGSK